MIQVMNVVGDLVVHENFWDHFFLFASRKSKSGTNSHQTNVQLEANFFNRNQIPEGFITPNLTFWSPLIVS